MSERPELSVDVVTIFPDYLDPLRASLLGKAIERGQVRVAVHDLRTWTTDVHKTVDDTPYGGGPGMVMLPEPWAQALDSIAPADGVAQPRLVIPTPTGRRFTQALAVELAAEPWLFFACGRYEGIDARLAEYAGQRMAIDEISLGDYVLCGGEVAVLVIMEAVARLLPGVLGNAASAGEDSFTDPDHKRDHEPEACDPQGAAAQPLHIDLEAGEEQQEREPDQSKDLNGFVNLHPA